MLSHGIIMKSGIAVIVRWYRTRLTEMVGKQGKMNNPGSNATNSRRMLVIASVAHCACWIAFGLLRPFWGPFALIPMLISAVWVLLEVRRYRRQYRDE
jgi:Na+/H+ antiporter NhaD/arsenite permease-like protein